MGVRVKMTRNGPNALNEVHVAQLNYHSSCYRRIQMCLERQPHTVAIRLFAAPKLTEKN